MSRIIRRLMPLLLLSLLAGCGVDHGLDLSKLNNLQYARDGESDRVQTLQLSKSGKAFIALIGWLEQNRWGWTPLEATLLPGGLSIYGDGFDLRVVHRTVILRYLDASGEYRQLHKKISGNIFTFLPGEMSHAYGTSSGVQ